jgi:hypothetical protein
MVGPKRKKAANEAASDAKPATPLGNNVPGAQLVFFLFFP